jgi:hypothetical protein
VEDIQDLNHSRHKHVDVMFFVVIISVVVWFSFVDALSVDRRIRRTVSDKVNFYYCMCTLRKEYFIFVYIVHNKPRRRDKDTTMYSKLIFNHI